MNEIVKTIVQQFEEKSHSYKEKRDKLLSSEVQFPTRPDILNYYNTKIEENAKKIARAEKDHTKTQLKIFAYFLITALLLAAIIFSITYQNQKISGFAVSSGSEIFQQNVNLKFTDQSTLYSWIPEKEGNLSYLKISGYIEKNGSAKIYFGNFSVFINNSISEQIDFSNYCEDTCSLENFILTKENANLKINLNNTNLFISAIIYQLETSQEIIPSQINETANITESSEETNPPAILQEPIQLNQPVKWKKIIILDQAAPVKLTLPAEADNIIVKKISESGQKEDITKNIEIKDNNENSAENKKLSASKETQAISPITGNVIGASENSFASFLKNFFSGITGLVISNSQQPSELTLTINENATEYEIEYETPAPTSKEEPISGGKRITISAPSELNYTDVISFTEISESFNLKSSAQIKLFHIVNGSRVEYPFTLQDKDNNGILDYIEWTTSHLSDQIFEIIIITKAQHLNENREFISDIYESIRSLDNNWSEEIPGNDYIRVTFQRKLTDKNDITLFPKIISGSPKIEVYEFNKSALLATFDNLAQNEYNKIYLTNLSGEQDTFDLQVQGGSIQLDHILDPTEILLLIGNSTTLCGEVTAYTKIWINSTGVLNICPFTTAGTGFVNITLGKYGNFTIDTGGRINGNGTGGTGGAGAASTGTGGTGTQGTDGNKSATGSKANAANGGGGGGGVTPAKATGAGGGGAGFGGEGGTGGNDTVAGNNAGLKGLAYGSSADLVLKIGSGGGGGAGDNAINGMAGGGGIKINASSGVINIAGIINVTGIKGQTGADATDQGAGGGGSGGHIILIARTLTVTSANLDARGGEGGNTISTTGDNCGGGGAGGGRIVLVYETLNNFSSTTYSINKGNAGSGNNGCEILPAAGTAGTISYIPLSFPTPDLTNPSITFTSPANNTNSSNSQIGVNYTASDTNLQACWYFNQTGNTTLANCGTNITGIIWREGKNNVTVWANDSWGNEGQSSIVFFIDTIKPNIAISAPPNGINTTNNQIQVNYTASDTNLQTCWYSNNTGNTTLTNCQTNITGIIWDEGQSNVTVFANDSVNNVNLSSVTFTVDTISPNINFTFPTEKNGDNLTERSNIVINVTASNILLANITIYLFNSTALVNETTTTTSPNFVNITDLPNEIYKFNATAYDSVGNFNRTETRTINISVIAANNPPTIISVDSISAQDLVENNLKEIMFNFTAYDAEGASTLTGAQANFTRLGETTRTNLTCSQIEAAGSYANYSCLISMQYWDGAGNWNISVSVNDSGNLWASNISTFFQINSLKAIQISPSSLSWGQISRGAANQTPSNDPIIINNTGNYNGTISVNATDVLGDSDFSYGLWANNFTVAIVNGSSALVQCEGSDTNQTSIMSPSNYVNVSNATLIKGNLSANDGTAQRKLYFCLRTAGSELIGQKYSTATNGAWTIKLLVIALAVKGRRKKKKLSKDIDLAIEAIQKEHKVSRQEIFEIIKEKEVQLDRSIPAEIFSTELGFLEALTKYLHENRKMAYHEIALILERDERTIWTAYNKAKEKQKLPLSQSSKATEISIPLDIFRNRNLTILESLVIYLKKSMKYSEIARLLNRNQRNIWTVYSRAIRKKNL